MKALVHRIALLIALTLLVVGGSANVGSEAWALSYADSTAQAIPVQIRSVPPLGWEQFHLRRAAAEWAVNNPRGVVEHLVLVDLRARFEGFDRAAFLLAEAYLQLGEYEEFDQLAEVLVGDTAYLRWIRYRQLWREGAGAPTETPEDFPAAGILSASLLLESGDAPAALKAVKDAKAEGAWRAVALHLRALAEEATGQDARGTWRKLSEYEADTEIEAELVGAAALRLAVATLEAGEDPTEYLGRIKTSSRFHARALHMKAAIALERGEVPIAIPLLDSLLETYPAYAGRRDALLLRGGLEMDDENWQGALSQFLSAERSWQSEYDSLTVLEDPDRADELWARWGAVDAGFDELRADAAPVDALASALAKQALALDRDIDMTAPTTDDIAVPARPVDDPFLLRYRPTDDEWSALRAQRDQRRHAQLDLARYEHEIELERRRLARRRAYLERGLILSDASQRELAAAIARLELLLARLDISLAELQGARDEEIARIAMRTSAMLEGLRRDLVFLQAMRHFYVDGPHRDRPMDYPEGVPSHEEVLGGEQSLILRLMDYLTLYAEAMPALIDSSFAQLWEPRLMGDSRGLHAALKAQLARADSISIELTSTLDLNRDEYALAAIYAQRDSLAAQADAMLAAEHQLQAELAAGIASRGRVQLEFEREALDYHLADASFEWAIQLATDPEIADQSAVVNPARSDAIARLQTFLERYPETIARAEARFRLADLKLLEAREDFQNQMARFLGEQPDADKMGDRSLAPFVNYAAAIELYSAILLEDPDFPHLDAVLFGLGMILSDDGQIEGTTHLERLVNEYPDSDHVQEAWLRMGDDRFAQKDFAGCIRYFENAAQGSDSGFTAIALYKMGWSHFEQDGFMEAADSFRRLLDVYASSAASARANSDSTSEGADAANLADLTSTDLSAEAEEYLVHSLSRAGGAEYFAEYFDGLGGRAYESDILLAMAHLLRGYSLYEEAIGCDAMWLSRYPDQPKALSVAQRQVETYARWNKPEQAREAQLVAAERFLPSGSWYLANESDSLRTEATAFAQKAYRSEAVFFHHKAREDNRPESWQKALSGYETFLTHWPDHGESARMHYQAGEAASQLKSYSLALDHFESAAASDTASFAQDAAWQRVAISDAWYRSTAPSVGQGSGVGAGSGASPSSAGKGADSLAVRLIDAGTSYLERYSGDEKSADILWRQANVAYAHDWYDRAADAFATMHQTHPRDKRVPMGLRLRGDAYTKQERYQHAGVAYEDAMAAARAVGQDSLATALAPVIPLSHYKHAESVASAATVAAASDSSASGDATASADSTDSQASPGEIKAAPLFAEVARRWPKFEYADLSLYRAGLGFAAGGEPTLAASAWQNLLDTYPESEHARDSSARIALVLEQSGDTVGAARAYERFSQMYPQDEDAPDALLRASDMLAQAGDTVGAERMRSTFLTRFPGEKDAVMEIRSERARAELQRAQQGGGGITALLGSGASAGSSSGATSSELASYLKLAAENPDLADPVILAQVDFMKAEAVFPQYASLRLTQPLPKSIERKRAKLEEIIGLYDACTRHGIGEYTRASAYRIGEALVAFGDALMQSERPADLTEDDLYAYDEVLEEQSWQFYDRGEEAWSELLKLNGGNEPDEWIVKTRQSLWPRVAQRFIHQPEVDYPLVQAVPPSQESD